MGWLQAYFALRDRAGAQGGKGHADETAELDSISAERCWREGRGGRGLHGQVGESLPIVRGTPMRGRGDGMVLWNTCVPGVWVDIFLVWFGRQSTDRVTGSCNGLFAVCNSRSSTRVPGCFTAAGRNVHVYRRAQDSGGV